MYLIAFTLTYILVTYRIKHENIIIRLKSSRIFSLWAIIGLILGARLGYVFFYNFDYYLKYPLR